MKAGSLLDDTTPLLCESPERRHPQEKCASKFIRGTFLSAFIYFFSITNLILHVWLSKQKHQIIANCQLPIADWAFRASVRNAQFGYDMRRRRRT